MARSPDYDEVLCFTLFKLARRHTWGTPVPADQFFQSGFSPEERAIAEDDILPGIRRGNIEFIGYRDSEIWLRGDKHDEAAYFLRDQCGYEEYRIEATLSRFNGFDW